MGTIILTACIAAAAAIAVYVLVTNYVLKNSIKKRCEAAVKEAEAEGEMIKKEKILQAKEKFIQLKSEHDRMVNERNQKLAQSEQKAKQIENNLQNQQRELDGKLRENDRLKEQMQNQMQVLEHRKEEVDQMMREQNARLEQISGMSSEEAKNILIENMKAEAKADAAAYVSETIEEAKLTATKEAKRIIVSSIQRVATETAIENAVTVFNIESDEVKGRIIGREGRNIRALEAATGIEIIVDDTPEAIILSGFDPVRREIAEASMDQSEAKRTLGFDPEKPLLLVVGGSLGARTINESISAALPEITAAGINVLWQTGKTYAEQCRDTASGYAGNVIASPFISDMATAYRAADLIVARAGAATISELQLLGAPAILVPSPNVAEDHQRKNAQALVDRDAAVMVLDSDARQALGKEILALMADGERRRVLGNNAAKMALRESDERIADEIDKILRKGN